MTQHVHHQLLLGLSYKKQVVEIIILTWLALWTISTSWSRLTLLSNWSSRSRWSSGSCWSTKSSSTSNSRLAYRPSTPSRSFRAWLTSKASWTWESGSSRSTGNAFLSEQTSDTLLSWLSLLARLSFRTRWPCNEEQGLDSMSQSTSSGLIHATWSI